MKKLIAGIALAAAVMPASAQIILNGDGPSDVNLNKKLLVAKNLIENFYVDSVNSDTLVQEAIVGMLKTLDPHSTYTNAEETRAITEPLNGNFSGIGIQFQMLQDTVYVIQPVAGGPSQKVGILPGDRIVAANDTAIAGVKMPQSQVMKRLRGPKGSVARLKVVRRSERDTLTFRVIRDDIPVNTVDAYYMAAPNVGYIRITSFGAETTEEFINAWNDLANQGMRNMIIDLQDNGGGYLQSAVTMAERFLPMGSVLVYTQGRNDDPTYYYSDNEDAKLQPRIVVMTNEYSASASEILAGALQDNDRGVVVGRRTFGKGLVQRPFPFPDGSMIRLTTAHYYTPSGRSIQKPYEKGNYGSYANDLNDRYKHGEFTSADSIHLDENLKYTTKAGRTVYGGGGIMPDKFVPLDTTGVNRWYRELRAKNVINQYVAQYVEQHRKLLKSSYPTEQKFIDDFKVTPEMIQELADVAQSLGVEPDPEQIAESTSFLTYVIKGLIGRDLFTTTTYSKVVNPMNPVFSEALRIITTPDEYYQLLEAPTQPKSKKK